MPEVRLEPAVEASDAVPISDLPSQDVGELAQARVPKRSVEEIWNRWGSGGEAVTEGAAEGEARKVTLEDFRQSQEATRGAMGRVFKDIGKGLFFTPSEVAGGAAEAINNAIQLGREVDAFIDREIVNIPWFDPEEEPIARLPEAPESETVTGGAIRAASRFLAGFLAAKRATAPIQAVQAVAGSGFAGQAAVSAAQGAIADFAVFEGHEQRLSDLIESVPELSNPVTAFLATDEDDPEIVGRLKNVLEGAGLGLATDGILAGLRAVRGSRAVQPAVDTATAQLRDLDEVVTQRKRILTDLSGDPAKPAVRIDPVSAEAAEQLLEEGGTAGTMGKVEINWGPIQSPDDVKQMVQDLADARSGTIKEAQRGVRTWRATRRSADEIDAWDMLQSRRVGEPLNAEQSVAARELWISSGRRVRVLANTVNVDPSPLNQIALRRQIAIHNAIQDQVLAARTETARALNAWKIPTGQSMEFDNQLQQLVRNVEEGTDTVQIARHIRDLGEIGMADKIDSFLNGTVVARGKDMLLQLYYNSILSSPHTHARNVISAPLVGFQSIVERRAANLIGQALGREAVSSGEDIAMIAGAWHGLKDSFRISAAGRRTMSRAAKRAARGDFIGASRIIDEAPEGVPPVVRSLATGQTGFGISKVDLPSETAFDPRKLGLDPDSTLGRVAQYVDAFTSPSTRALTAEDEVASSILGRMELYAQAHRRVTREVQEGVLAKEMAADRLTTLVNNPDEAMRLMSQRFAEVGTFRNTPLKTRAWDTFSSVGKFPFGIGRLLLPFKRTPFNIATYSFERTPLAPFVKQWRTDVLSNDPAIRDLAWSRFLVGNAILLSAANLAASGVVTGEGTQNYRQRETQRRQQIKPWTIQIGDKSFNYRGIEPIAYPLGIAATTIEILSNTDFEDDDRSIEQLWLAAGMSIANQVTSAQYMSTVSEAFEMMGDPSGTRAENFFERIVSPVVPNIVANATRSFVDPFQREVQGFADALKRRTFGMSEELPFRRDLWGRPDSSRSPIGSVYDFMSPIYVDKIDKQPIDVRLTELEKWIGKPTGRTSFDLGPEYGSVNVNLKRVFPKLYDRWLQLSGNTISEDADGVPITAAGGLYVSEGRGLMDELNAIVTGRHGASAIFEELSGGSDGGQATFIERIVQAHYKAGKTHVLAESDELRAELQSRALLGETEGFELEDLR